MDAGLMSSPKYECDWDDGEECAQPNEDYNDNGYEEDAQLESNLDVETQSIRSGEDDGTPEAGNGAGQGGEHYKEQLALLEECSSP